MAAVITSLATAFGCGRSSSHHRAIRSTHFDLVRTPATSSTTPAYMPAAAVDKVRGVLRARRVGAVQVPGAVPAAAVGFLGSANVTEDGELSLSSMADPRSVKTLTWDVVPAAVALQRTELSIKTKLCRDTPDSDTHTVFVPRSQPVCYTPNSIMPNMGTTLSWERDGNRFVVTTFGLPVHLDELIQLADGPMATIQP